MLVDRICYLKGVKKKDNKTLRKQGYLFRADSSRTTHNSRINMEIHLAHKPMEIKWDIINTISMRNM